MKQIKMVRKLKLKTLKSLLRRKRVETVPIMLVKIMMILKTKERERTKLRLRKKLLRWEIFMDFLESKF